MEKININIFKIIGTHEASIDFLAVEVKKQMNFSKQKINVLDFDNIDYTTTAFLNVLLAGFIDTLDAIEELQEYLTLANHDKGILFAFQDAYSLLKRKLEMKS